MSQKEQILQVLEKLEIGYNVHEHPPVETVEDALDYWKDIDATHCKNIFLRNKKGNKHYLVILKYDKKLAMTILEQKLKEGKLSFASEKRLTKYLNLQQGAVSPFGLINDTENHVHVFIDNDLNQSQKVSFHPNVNTATLVLDFSDFKKFIEHSGNSWEWIEV